MSTQVREGNAHFDAENNVFPAISRGVKCQLEWGKTGFLYCFWHKEKNFFSLPHLREHTWKIKGVYCNFLQFFEFLMTVDVEVVVDSLGFVPIDGDSHVVVVNAARFNWDSSVSVVLGYEEVVASYHFSTMTSFWWVAQDYFTNVLCEPVVVFLFVVINQMITWKAFF